MKKSGKTILYMIITISIITIVILIGIILNLLEKNKIIDSKETSVEQLTETTSSNAYVDMATHLSEVSNSAASSAGIAIKLADTASNSFTINVADYYDGDLTTLTADNFLCDIKKQTVTGTGGKLLKGSNTTSKSASQTISKTYDSSTGTFTAKIAGASVTAYCVSQGLCAYGEDFTTWTGQFTASSKTTFIPYLVIGM